MNAKYPVKCEDFNNARKNALSIKIFLCDKCNFNCEYCYNKIPRTYQEINIEQLIKFYIYLKQLSSHKKFFIELIGGEPTLHKDIDKFLLFIQNTYPNDNVLIYSNFSKSIEQYINYIKMNFISFDFSYHLKADNKLNNNFIDKTNKLIQFLQLYQKNIKQQYFTLSIMIEKEFINKILFIYKILKKKILNNNLADIINVECLEIEDPLTGKSIYSSQQTKQILDFVEKESSVDSIVTYSDNTISYETLFNLNYNPIFNFTGWKCNAGLTRLYIHCDGNIYECQTAYESLHDKRNLTTKNVIGNIYDFEGFKLNQTICKYDFCACEQFVYKVKN